MAASDTLVLEIYLSAGVDIFEDYQQFIIEPGFDYMQPLKEDFDKIVEVINAPHEPGMKIISLSS